MHLEVRFHTRGEFSAQTYTKADALVATRLRLFLGGFWEAFWPVKSFREAFENVVQNMPQLRRVICRILAPFRVPFLALACVIGRKLLLLGAVFLWWSPGEGSDGSWRTILGGFSSPQEPDSRTILRTL